MQITPFGCIIAIYLLYIVCRYCSDWRKVLRILFLSGVASLIFFDVGYFAVIGGTTIEYNYVFSVATFIAALIVLIAYPVDIRPMRQILILTGVLLIGIAIPWALKTTYVSVAFDDLWDLYFDADIALPSVGVGAHSLFLWARVLMSAVSVYAFVSVSEKQDWTKYLKAVYAMGIVVLCLSLLEGLWNNAGHPTGFRNLVFAVFGHSEATYEFPREFAGIYLPMLFMREPSSYSRMLFFIAMNDLVLHFSGERKKGIWISVGACLMLIVASGALSSLVYLLALGAVLFYRSDLYERAVLIPSAAVLLIVGCLLFSDRIQTALTVLASFSSAPSDLPRVSEIIRMYSIYNNLALFLRYPLLGCGLGSVYCFSSVVTILADIGIVGTGMYLFFIKSMTDRFFSSRCFSMLALVVIVLSHGLTGHLSQLLYLENGFYLILLLKYTTLKQKEEAREMTYELA